MNRGFANLFPRSFCDQKPFSVATIRSSIRLWSYLEMAASSTVGAVQTESVVCGNALVIGSSASAGPLIKVGAAHSSKPSLHQTLSFIAKGSGLRPSHVSPLGLSPAAYGRIGFLTR